MIVASMESPAMTTIIGSGQFTYRVVESWGRLPEGWAFGDVAAVGVDRHDRVYAFNRGKHPMVVFDRDGAFVTSWGEDIFTRAHGIHMAPDDTIFCTDDGDHTVRQCTPDGKVLLEIGIPGKPAPYMSGEPFNRCTHTALSPQGELYVSDGYGNSCVHKFSPDGKLLLSWGEPGTDPGQFNIAHNICCDDDGWVYVADRENHRIQVFDGKGRFETQWVNMHRPSGLFMTAGKCPLCYIAELGPHLDVNRELPNIGPRISVMDQQGKLLARIAATPPRGTAPGQFISPHGIAADSAGNLYVGEVSYTSWSRSFPDVPRPKSLRCLHKLERVGQAVGTAEHIAG
jgi:DNA-binding beta-propeller fold protein YncE